MITPTNNMSEDHLKQWKRGDIGSDGRLFWGYGGTYKNGMRWAKNKAHFLQMQESHKQWKLDHPEKVKSHQKKAFAKYYSVEVNKEKIRASKKNWLKTPSGKAYKKEKRKTRSTDAKRRRSKKVEQRDRDQLHPRYLADLLDIRVSALRKVPDLLEAKREQIKILRELKQQTENQNAPNSK